MKYIPLFVVSAFMLVATTSSVEASHALGYHWARTADTFTLELGDNVSATWDSYLGAVAGDWSASTVLDTVVAKGKARPTRQCEPTLGRVEVCSYAYGLNDWMGLAQSWIAPDGEHVTQVTVQLNDSYFTDTAYDTPTWRRSVMCHEIGHALGLDHQDEDFYNVNLGTCLDYTTDPTGNEQPNQHDFDELELVYSHLDSYSTVGSKGKRPGQAVIDVATKHAWGKRISSDTHVSVYEKTYADGSKVLTRVMHAQ